MNVRTPSAREITASAYNEVVAIAERLSRLIHLDVLAYSELRGAFWIGGRYNTSGPVAEVTVIGGPEVTSITITDPDADVVIGVASYPTDATELEVEFATAIALYEARAYLLSH